MIGCLVLLCVIGWTGPARARGAVSVSLPLEGHYRPGKYMPVRIAVTDHSGVLWLTAAGAVETQVEIPASGDAIIPWLGVSEALTQAHISEAAGEHPLDLRLRALNEDERLVAIAGAGPEIAAILFPGKTIIPVSLDLSRPLLQPAQAWETLDAIVLSPAAAARVSDEQIQTLLGAGTVLAVASVERPDARWPWKRAGGCWVLRHEPAGPGSVIEPAAYAPTYDWQRDWPASFRREVVFEAIVFCILATALTLWRSRRAVWAFLGLCAAAAGLFVLQYVRQPVVLDLSAGIAVSSAGVTQFDLWSWQSPLRATDISYPAAGLTHPVFATLRQIEETHIRLLCGPDGRPSRFRFHLEPNQTLAVLTRIIRPGPLPSPSTPINPVFKEFAENLYARPGDRTAGQIELRNPYTSEPVPVILVQRP